jgi:hypothetical protein
MGGLSLGVIGKNRPTKRESLALIVLLKILHPLRGGSGPGLDAVLRVSLESGA